MHTQTNFNSQRQTGPATLRCLLWSLAALALLSIPFGCSETVTPTEETFSPILRVEVYERTPPPGNLRLVENAEVQLNRIPLSNDQIGGIVATSRIENREPAVFTDLDVLITGELYTVLVDAAGRAGFSPEFLMCADTTVRLVIEPPSILNCSNPNVRETLRFFDDQFPPNPELIQNTPIGSEQYCIYVPITAPANDELRVNIPPGYGNVGPFTLVDILVNNAEAPRPSFDLAPGQTATFQFCVSTAQAGDFDEQLPPFEIQCIGSGQSGNVRFRLQAEVVPPECDCDRNFEASFDFEQVRVGSQAERAEVVFENTFPCEVTIEAPTPFITAPFQLISPAPNDFPLTLAPGQSLTLRVQFAPLQAGEFEMESSLAVITPNVGDDCAIELEIEGIGCNDACPLLSLNGAPEYTLDGRSTLDTMSNRPDRRVYFYTDAFDRNPGIAVELRPVVERTMTLIVPDTLCEESDFELSVIDATPNDGVDDLQYFSISPQNFSVSPGEEREVTVRFTAPRVDEFKNTIEPTRAPQDPSDSLFSIILRLRSQGCEQIDTLHAVVTNCPNFVPLVELVAYDQTTRQQPQNADYQVYYFCQPRSQDIQSEFADLAPDNPPIYGDLYVTVPNPAQPDPPQLPTLHIRTQGQDPRLGDAEPLFDAFAEVPLGGVFAGIDTPEEFKDVCGQIIPSFCSIANNLNYNLTQVQLDFTDLGKIYAFRPAGGGESGFALIYINRVDNGQANNALISSVGFYAIGCIDCSAN